MDYFLVLFFAWIMVGYMVNYRVSEFSPAIGLTLMRVAGNTNRAIRCIYLITKFLTILLWPFCGWITLLGTKISFAFLDKKQ